MQSHHPLTHLVLVCCHATYRAGSDPHAEAAWMLQDFQKSNPASGKVGEHYTFMAHIAAGASILAQDPNALLIFSGGKTQSQVDLTEAESYEQVRAQRTHWQSASDGTLFENRCKVETHATDSYQNLLFSIIRFKTLTASYPARITVITHAFKERRFLELHAGAIKWPPASLRVMGINPPMTLPELKEVQQGEVARAYSAFANDLYGAREPLANKRIARGWNPDCLDEFAGDVEDAVRELLEWKGGATGLEQFPGKLPWEHN